MVHMDISVHQRVAVTARIDERLAEQLKAIAAKQDRSVAAELRRAVAAHVQAGSPKSETA